MIIKNGNVMSLIVLLLLCFKIFPGFNGEKKIQIFDASTCYWTKSQQTQHVKTNQVCVAVLLEPLGAVC